MSVLLVLVTFPDMAKARELGTRLVDEQLAACVNLLPAVESIYRWQGQVENAAEVLAIFKTTDAAFPELEAKLRSLHPYDVPEIVAVKPEQVSANYAQWVRDSVTG